MAKDNFYKNNSPNESKTVLEDVPTETVTETLAATVEVEAGSVKVDQLSDGTVIGDLAQAKEVITLINRNRTAIIIESVNGDTLSLPPGEHPVPGHFNWNLPVGIKVKE